MPLFQSFQSLHKLIEWPGVKGVAVSSSAGASCPASQVRLAGRDALA